MKALFVVLVVCVSLSLGFQYTEEWELWKTNFNRKYETLEEELRRQIIWESNKLYVENHNKNADKLGFTLAMNQFADMDVGEFSNFYNGYLQNFEERNSTNARRYVKGQELAGSVDWRTHGAVTPVKNQLQCGSCWSFSATGSLEGQHFLRTGTLVSLSEQQLIDCSTAYGTHGCKGGIMDSAFRYLEIYPDEQEYDYPYEARQGYCRYNQAKGLVGDKGYRDIYRGSEISLQEAVMNVGPISVAIDASHRSLQLYEQGVYSDPQCSSTKLDHGVLVVGYGTQGFEDYWIVKNSWGGHWGMDGYFLLARNRNNACGVATQASYPLV